VHLGYQAQATTTNLSDEPFCTLDQLIDKEVKSPISTPANIHTQNGNPSDHRPYRYLLTPHLRYLHVYGYGENTYIKVLKMY